MLEFLEAGQFFGMRQFPKAGHARCVRRALSHEYETAAKNYGYRDTFALRLLAFELDGKLTCSPGGMRATHGPNRTGCAVRIARQADGRTELHHGLVVLARMRGIEIRLCDLLETAPGQR